LVANGTPLRPPSRLYIYNAPWYISWSLILLMIPYGIYHGDIYRIYYMNEILYLY